MTFVFGSSSLFVEARIKKMKRIKKKKRRGKRRRSFRTRFHRRKVRYYPFHRKGRRRKLVRTPKRLKRELKHLLRYRGLRRAKIGVVVMSEKGKILFQHNPMHKLIPASNVKLLTMAAAFSYLGPHYRFKTKLLWGFKDCF